MMPHGQRHQPVSRIADARHARVANHGNVVPALQVDDQLGGARQLVVLVIADGGLVDAVVVQQRGRVPRVLAGDEVNLLEHVQRAQSDVFQIANGRADEIKRPRRGLVAVALITLP